MGDKRLLFTNDFETSLPNAFRRLWTDEYFTDVTLATEDDHQIKAHKVILSLCSEFFRNLFIKNPHQNPLIYLKGIRYKELEVVLKFIYLGKCDVENEEITKFLATGSDLRINGLVENFETGNVNYDGSEIYENSPPMESGQEEISQKKILVNNVEKEDIFNVLATESDLRINGFVGKNEIENDDDEIKINEISNSLEPVHEDMGGLSQKPILSNSEISHKVEQNNLFNPNKVSKTQQTGDHDCTICEKKYTTHAGLFYHNRSIHLGYTENCDKCEFKATQKSHLKAHQLSEHEGLRYPCDQCNFKAKQQSTLKKHKQSKHENTFFYCDQCDYKTKRQEHLKIHQNTLHGDVRYECDQCEYSSKAQSNLRSHHRTQHEGVIFKCDECSYTTSDKSNLNKHNNCKHDKHC